MKKKKRLSGIERRWFVNNVGVIMLLVLACVLGVVLSMAAYYDTNLRSGLENRANTTTDFFSNYIGQSYNEYYQSCIKFAKTFEDKDRLELQFISPGGKIVDVNIRRLRIKIEDDTASPTYITTVWGFGYKWGA